METQGELLFAFRLSWRQGTRQEDGKEIKVRAMEGTATASGADH